MSSLKQYWILNFFFLRFLLSLSFIVVSSSSTIVIIIKVCHHKNNTEYFFSFFLEIAVLSCISSSCVYATRKLFSYLHHDMLILCYKVMIVINFVNWLGNPQNFIFCSCIPRNCVLCWSSIKLCPFPVKCLLWTVLSRYVFRVVDKFPI